MKSARAPVVFLLAALAAAAARGQNPSPTGNIHGVLTPHGVQ